MSGFSFVPPNRGALWAQLRLTKSQLAAMSGLTVRQITYWADRGYLVAVASAPPRYDGHALDTCILLKKARYAGIPLEHAHALVRAYLATEVLAQPDARGLGTVDLDAVREELRGAVASLQTVLQVAEGLAALKVADAGHRGGPAQGPREA